jgi:lysozyme family protein
MRGNFERALAAVLVHEGGYVNHPKDPGGATNKGVTQRVYDDYRLHRGMAPRSVRHIQPTEIEDIYRRQYWDAVRCDDLPAGVDYCVFDLAVNSGTNRAARFLQRAVGVLEDGKIGPITIAAVKNVPPALLVDSICDERICFLRSLGTFATFGKGWTRRVSDVRDHSKAMA